jgi:isochorismate pyruvate lyase
MDQRLSRTAEPAIPPADCHVMADVRREIDRLDRALVKLIAERQGYIERAAEIKQRRDTVRDEARIADVLSKVLAEAQKHGLSAEIAEPVWRTLMENCIAHEFKKFDALQAQRN